MFKCYIMYLQNILILVITNEKNYKNFTIKLFGLLYMPFLKTAAIIYNINIKQLTYLLI